MKDELGRRILIEFIKLRPKAHRYLRDDNEEYGKTKKRKKTQAKVCCKTKT